MCCLFVCFVLLHCRSDPDVLLAVCLTKGDAVHGDRFQSWYGSISNLARRREFMHESGLSMARNWLELEYHICHEPVKLYLVEGAGMHWVQYSPRFDGQPGPDDRGQGLKT
jgi:hypothetical protein